MATVKSADKYRFSLQWSAESEERIQAGEFLESLGNRKSELVILAVTEYLNAHPEISAPGSKLKIVIKPELRMEQVKAMIQTMIEENLSGRVLEKWVQNTDDGVSRLAESEADVDEMLKNLDLFS